MGVDTKIEWCHHTANTWWGCNKVSDGCKNCYAETFAKRTGHDVWGPKGSRRMMKGVWNEVRKWAVAAAAAGERRRVFWGSMMDVCEDRPELAEPRKRFCGLVEELEDLDFLLLTKRPENYTRLLPWGTALWPFNAWAMASAENQARLEERVPHLLKVGASIRGLSCEPLLGTLDFSVDGLWETQCPRCRDFGCFVDESTNACECGACQGTEKSGKTGINWVIVGSESGPGARPCNIEWIRSIVRQCQDASVACFVKQLKHAGSKDPKGGRMDEWPDDIRVRQMPEAK